MLRVRVCGGLELAVDGRSLPDGLVGGRQGRLVFAYLLCERRRAVRKEELAELLWPDRLPDSWSASLSAVVSRLRRLLGEAGLDGAETLVSTAGAYQLLLPPDSEIDLDVLEAAVAAAETGAVGRDVDRALVAAATAEAIGRRGFLTDDCDWVDQQRDMVRDLLVRATLARSTAHLAADQPARAVEAARDALALDDAREAAYRHLMRALAAAGERAEALRVWERCRTTLAETLGIDPSPDTEAVYLDVLGATPSAPATASLPSGVVTFLLTDIVDSSSLWEHAPDAMAVALERHDALVGEVVAAHGGTLLKSKLEGDATVSVFARASDGALAALALHAAVSGEGWPEGAQPRLRMALHTGEAFERGGDYFGPALNRAARLRALGGAGEVLLSQAVTELVRDHLPRGVGLRDLGHRDLRGMSRGENVFQLTRTDSPAIAVPAKATDETRLVPPALPVALVGAGPFVGRGDELQRLVELWEQAAAESSGAVFVGGEPGVGKSRLAAELATLAHAAGAVVLHGRCDEDLSAALQPFIEALRPLIPPLGAARIAAVGGVDELARVLPELTEHLPDRGPTVRADPDTERLALFDAFVNLLRAASVEAPVLLVLDDLHWAGKTTLSLLRHVLRGAKGARLLVVGTYRDTELARTHPLAETLADLRRDGAATRISLSGLGSDDVDAYLSAIGIDDRALGRQLTEITSGNPYFLIEVVRHVEETGGTWSTGDLPEGVREATGRRLSRLSDATNRALSTAAVVGASFDLALLEQVDGNDLLDEIGEACHAGLVVEEVGVTGRFRFAHALVRQVLLDELVTIKRARLHRRIAELLDAAPVGADPESRLADLAYHWYECASLGDTARAVDACRRAADHAMQRLAYEEAGDLYSMALQVLDGAEDADLATRAELHLARCDALLAAGDVTRAREAIDALEEVAPGSERLAAWYTTYAGMLAVLAEPDRLTEIVGSIGAAADAMRALGDLRGEAQAHCAHATALERLGRIGAAERALDAALAAARDADDRRLQDSILAEAPLAALWGPSSVTRASGRCLDVVRVLRINGGAPAVESVAIRCQAVLEALRGRPDAARRMIASARRTAERLGLTHRRLETEVAAGFIELLDGSAAEAERILRSAYEGLRERGLGGEAAQAAAFLGRALLQQGRVDDADTAAAEAEALAGADLKASIAWRGVRAECAARRGDVELALRLAGEAVELAAATDALLLVADARLALAAVRRASGDEAGAEEEARRALEACSAKGATVLAARVGLPSSVVAASEDPPVAQPNLEAGSNAAATAVSHLHAVFNSGDLEKLAALWHPELRSADRRSLMTADNIGPDAIEFSVANFRLAYDGGTRYATSQPLVTRGEHAALLRWELRSPGAVWPQLGVVRIDDSGRFTDWIVFDVGDRRAANLELERLAPAVDDHDTSAWRAASRLATAINERDWDGFVAGLSPTYHVDDRRPGIRLAQITALENYRTLFGLEDAACERTAVALHGDRRVLCREVVWFRDGAVEAAEITSLVLFEVDDAGLVDREMGFGGDDLDAALAALGADDAGSRTLAERAMQCFVDALNDHSWDRTRAMLAPSYEHRDRRPVVTEPDRRDPLERWQLLFSMADWSMRIEVLQTHGWHRVLARHVLWFRDQEDIEGEIEYLGVHEVDATGRIVRQISFASAEQIEALAELRSVPAEPSPSENVAWRGWCSFQELVERGDWEASMAALAPGFEYHDRRSGVGLDASGDAAFAHFRTAASLDLYRYRGTLLAVRGERLALVDDDVTFANRHSGTAEIASITLVESAGDGRVARTTTFDEGDLAAAFEELERRSHGAAWLASLRQEAALARRDWDAFAATLHPDYEYVERRRVMWFPANAEPDSFYRTMFALDEWHFERQLLDTRGDRLALVRQSCQFHDGAAGPAESSAVAVLEVADDGRVLRETPFEVDDEAAAREELDARARALAGPLLLPLPSPAWDAVQALDAALNAADWPAVIRTLAPSYELLDRRGFVSVGHLVGEDALNDYRLLFSMDEARIDHGLLATRGERLALVRTNVRFRSSAAGESEVECLTIMEVDTGGCITHEIGFDAGDMAAALDELDARYVALGGVDCSPFRRAFDARDWDAYGAVFDRDATVRDGRTAGFGRVGFGAFVEDQRSLVELSPDCRMSTDHVWHCDHAFFTYFRVFGTRNGGPWELAMWTVSVLGADGRVVETEAFELRELDAALQRFDELAAQGSGRRTNRAWEAVLAAYECFDRRDWEGFVRWHLPALVHDFRQRTTAHVLVGDDAFRSSRVMWEMDEAQLRNRFIEADGDRVVLVETEVLGSDGEVGDVEWLGLNVIELAEDGRIAASISFEPDDLDRALEHLHERARALVPAANAATELLDDLDAAFFRRDWDAFSARFGAEFRVDERRRTIARTFDDARALAVLRYAFDMPDLRWDRPVLATRGDALALVRDETASVGAGFEMTTLTLVELDDDGRVARHTTFDEDDLPAAISELDARAAARSSDPLAIPVNLAARSVGREGWSLLSALGDRICVHQTPDSFVVHEVDDEGVVRAEVPFDLADRRGAADEGARRYCRTNGIPQLASTSVALNARDVEATRETLSVSCEFHDHRPIGLSIFDSVRGWIESLASLFALVPDYLVELLRADAIRPWGHAVTLRASGTTTEDAPFENWLTVVSTWNKDGRVTAVHLFDPEQRAKAVALLDSLAP